MFKLIKSLFCVIFVIFFSATTFGAPYVNLTLNYDGKDHNYSQEAVYLYINGNKLDNLPMQPIIFNNSTLVPARETFEALGAKVLWNKDTYQIEIAYNEKSITIKIDDTKATVDAQTFEMPIAPKLINSKTMIPARFVSEAIGLKVDWDSKERIVNISNEVEQKLKGEIYAISIPDFDKNTFSISSNEKMEKFELSKLSDNAFCVDVYDFNSSISKSQFQASSKYINKIEIENNPQSTRFIFYLNQEFTTENVFGDLILSDDGKTLLINFGGNVIKKIEKFSNGNYDTINLYTEYKPKFSVEVNNQKTTIKLENVSFSQMQEIFNDTNIISDIKYIKNEEHKYLILEVNSKINVDVKQNFENGILSFNFYEKSEITQKPEITSNDTLTIPKVNNINIGSITQKDDYYNKKYSIIFNTDITSAIPEGSYPLSFELVKSLEVKNVSGNTNLNFTCNKIVAVDLSEDDKNIYIKFLLPKQKYKNIVVIDPGHGGSDGGTSGFGLKEKDITLDIGNYLVELINADPDIKVYTSRSTDTYPSFDDRTGLGNEVGDMFVSIHINAPGTPNNQAPNGTEVYYLNSNTSARGIKSEVMAETFLKNIVEYAQTKNRGVKTANFKVLRDSKIPAILCEIAFVTNPEDNKKLASEEYKRKIAQGLYQSIKEIFEKYPS